MLVVSMTGYLITNYIRTQWVKIENITLKDFLSNVSKFSSMEPWSDCEPNNLSQFNLFDPPPNQDLNMMVKCAIVKKLSSIPLIFNKITSLRNNKNT